MKHYRDARTGLTVGVPPGWQSIKTPLVAGVLRLAGPVPEAVFRPTAVATVVEVAPDESVAIFTERTTRALIGELGGRVLNVGVWMIGEFEGREVLTTYTTGGRAVVVASFLCVDGLLGTRIDVSFGIWDAPEGLEVARSIAHDITLPTRATPDSGSRQHELAQVLAGVSRG